MVSGFITGVQGRIVANKHVVAKVRHSQRMNDAPVLLWIVTEKDGTIMCSLCWLYGGTGGMLSPYCQCAFLHRRLNKNALKVGMYPGKMYLAVTNLCERNFICSCGGY